MTEFSSIKPTLHKKQKPHEVSENRHGRGWSAVLLGQESDPVFQIDQDCVHSTVQGGTAEEDDPEASAVLHSTAGVLGG